MKTFPLPVEAAPRRGNGARELTAKVHSTFGMEIVMLNSFASVSRAVQMKLIEATKM